MQELTVNEIMVQIPLDDYTELVEMKTKATVLAEAFMENMRMTEYGVTTNEGALIAVFRALFPEDYGLWLEDQKEDEDGSDIPL